MRIANEILMHFRGLRKTSQEIFISDPLDSDKEGNSFTLQDIMADDDNVFEQIDIKLKSERMYSYLIRHLTRREQQTIIMRYGLLGTPPMTQREVAKTLRISRSYVSRIEKRALQILRKQFQRDGFEAE